MTVTAVEGDDDAYRSLRDGPSMRGRTALVVDGPASAAEALRLALGGGDLVLHATAERDVLDRLYEDLRRVGSVDVRTGPTAPTPGDRLDPDGRALLQLLATGLTLNEAAAELHLSVRTANRRLAVARTTLGVETTIEAIAVVAAGSSPAR